jgi:hypothetical protein
MLNCLTVELLIDANVLDSSAGFGGGLRQDFHMEVRDRETGELIQNQTSDQPAFTIE